MVVRAGRPARHVLGSRALWVWRESGNNYIVSSAIKEDDAFGEMAGGQGTILMTDARYDKHVNAAPLDIIADLGSRRPE